MRASARARPAGPLLLRRCYAATTLLLCYCYAAAMCLSARLPPGVRYGCVAWVGAGRTVGQEETARGALFSYRTPAGIAARCMRFVISSEMRIERRVFGFGLIHVSRAPACIKTPRAQFNNFLTPFRKPFLPLRVLVRSFKLLALILVLADIKPYQRSRYKVRYSDSLASHTQLPRPLCSFPYC